MRVDENRPCITSVTAAICRAMGVSAPAGSDSRVLDLTSRHWGESRGAFRAEKCLVYAPDAVGQDLVETSPRYFEGIRSAGLNPLRLRSAFPPVTPVCFASMFSGLSPDVHGIRKYEKPVLRVPTLFDALLAAGKKPAIVSIKDSSIEMIFRGRDMDYHAVEDDDQVIRKVVELIESGRNDFILAYNEDYDETIHAFPPRGDKAMSALRNCNGRFMKLLEAFDEGWGGFDRLVLYTPDHGCHLDSATGNGDHGLMIPEDMHVLHFSGTVQAGDRILAPGWGR